MRYSNDIIRYDTTLLLSLKFTREAVLRDLSEVPGPHNL